MKRSKKLIALLCAGLLAIGMTGCGGGSDAGSAADAGAAEYNFNISVDAAEDETICKYANELAAQLSELSGGKITATVYPNGTLGGDSEALQSCADGSLDFVLSTTAPQVDIMPELAMFDLPNLFTDISQFRALFDNEEFYNELSDIYTGGGYKLLGIADSGFRQMSSNVKVETADDLAGIKIRTMQNANHIAIWQSYGANPTPMSFSDVYIGLQQGTIAAQENPIEVLVSSKFYEQQKYVVMTNHLPHACVLLMSGSVYSALPEDIQAIVDQASAAATQYTRELSDTQNEEQLQFLIDNGTEIIELSDDVLASLKEKAQPVYDTIRGQIGDKYMDMMLTAAGQQ